MATLSLGVSFIRALDPGDRRNVEEILTSTRSFHPSEVTVALALFDQGISAGGEPPLDPDYCWLGAQDGAQLAGVACYGPTPTTHGTFDLYWLAVAPSHQGRGIGGALLARVESAAHQLGGRLLVVETSSASSYDVPRAFYDVRGYALQATIRDFYRPGDDRLILVRRIAKSTLAGGRHAS